MQIQLIWTEGVSGEQRQPVLEIPVALGSDFNQMPSIIEGVQVSRIVLEDNSISPYHVLIQESNGQIIVTDNNSQTGTLINNVQLPSSTLFDGDRLRVGPIEIQVRIGANISNTEDNGCKNMVGFLFKRRCGRPKVSGSNYCVNCQNQSNPYAEDYAYYAGYGRYDSWGLGYYHHRDYYYYDCDTGRVEFTEADGVAFEQERTQDFERDFEAS
ncbi:MAG: FHA domain-containing protein [Prochloraceae cyanobacterium]